MAKRNRELEAAILEAPESPDAYLVYGDWLLEQGDPLGELVSVQATLAKLRTRAGKTKEKRDLERREKTLLKEAEERLGDLVEHEHTWSFGFLDGITIPPPSAKAYEALLAAPAARFLRELDIEDLPFSRDGSKIHPTIALLTRFGVAPSLRKLALLSSQPGHGDLGSFPAELWPKLASLCELTIKAGAFRPGHIDLPNLETLALATPITDMLLESLARAELPRLSSVQLDAVDGEPEDPTAINAERMKPLFATWANAGTLRHLGVTEHGAGDELAECLLETGLVQQLTSLDLSRAAMTDQGGQTILGNADAFARLESINLSENDLSSATARALEERFDLAVDIEEQGTRLRYDSIEE